MNLIRGALDKVSIARHGDLTLQIALIGYKRRNELRDYSMRFLLWNASDIGSFGHILGYVLFINSIILLLC